MNCWCCPSKLGGLRWERNTILGMQRFGPRAKGMRAALLGRATQDSTDQGVLRLQVSSTPG